MKRAKTKTNQWKILLMAAAGFSRDEVVTVTGLSPNSIRRILKKLGLKAGVVFPRRPDARGRLLAHAREVLEKAER